MLYRRDYYDMLVPWVLIVIANGTETPAEEVFQLALECWTQLIYGNGIAA
ncbi:MAG: hypothetical protein HQ495_10225 [Alphaproteobacteria bacterium]|nr:hypothetical protein [Alphaproteobacteria bacterium]